MSDCEAGRDCLQARIRELEREADERDKAHEGIVAMLGKEARADIASARAKVTLLAERLDERTLQRDRLAARIDKALALANTYRRQWVPGSEPKTFDQGVGAFAQDVIECLAADTPTTATAEPTFCKCGHVPELHNGDQRRCRGIGPIGLGFGCDCSGRFQPPATAERGEG